MLFRAISCIAWHGITWSKMDRDKQEDMSSRNKLSAATETAVKQPYLHHPKAILSVPKIFLLHRIALFFWKLIKLKENAYQKHIYLFLYERKRYRKCIFFLTYLSDYAAGTVESIKRQIQTMKITVRVCSEVGINQCSKFLLMVYQGQNLIKKANSSLKFLFCYCQNEHREREDIF